MSAPRAATPIEPSKLSALVAGYAAALAIEVINVNHTASVR